MRENRLRLYVHLVWATWDRLPLIESEWERRLHRNIADQAAQMNCRVLAINGMEDHVHLLLKMPATLSIAQLVKQVKGESSRFANEELRTDHAFKWQGSVHGQSLGCEENCKLRSGTEGTSRLWEIHR